MILLVNDANILIDLLKIGLLDSFFLPPDKAGEKLRQLMALNPRLPERECRKRLRAYT